MKRILFFTIALLLFSSSLQAQIVTPSMDPTRPSLTAAANSWRFHSTIGVENIWRKDDSASGYGYQNNQGYFTNIGWMPGNFVLEWTYRPNENFKVWSGTDPVTDRFESTQDIKLSVRGNGEVSVGVSSLSKTIQENGNSDRQRTGYGGSFGFRWGGLFGAYGLDVMKEEVTGLTAKRWRVSKMGLAYMVGDPVNSQFRLEYSIVDDPGATVTGTGPEAVVTDKYETFTSMEYHYHGYYMGVHNNTTSETANDFTSTELEYAAGFRTLDHSLIFSRADGTDTNGAAEHKFIRWRWTYGFNFM